MCPNIAWIDTVIKPKRTAFIALISSRVHVDLNPSIAGQFHAYIQNKSKLSVSVNTSGAYGSTIVSVTTTINGATYTEASFTTEALSKSGTQSYTVVVKDSQEQDEDAHGIV